MGDRRPRHRLRGLERDGARGECGAHGALRQRRGRSRPPERGRTASQVQRGLGLPRRGIRSALRLAGGASVRRPPEDPAPELPVLRRRPALPLRAQARRGARPTRRRLDGALRGAPPRRRRVPLRGAGLRGRLVPGLCRRGRGARHGGDVAAERGRGGVQPLRVAVDLGEEREAPSHGARGPRPLPASVLLREPGGRPEQRQERARLRRRHDRLRAGRTGGRPAPRVEGRRAEGGGNAGRGSGGVTARDRRSARVRRPRSRSGRGGLASSTPSRTRSPPASATSTACGAAARGSWWG